MINLGKVFKSIAIAWSGIIQLIKEENNAKIHLISTLLVIVVGLKLDFMSAEWLWITLAIAGVWIAELINSSLEKLTDLVSPENHPLAKKAKDYAAAAVLVMVIWAVVVFCIVSYPHLLMQLVFSN
jgi:diacylglycerol kinase